MRNLIKTKFYILAIFSTLVLGCKSELKSKDFDTQKTTEFLSQVLPKVEFLKTNCILETSNWKLFKLENDFKAYIQENLKTKDTTHLNLQLKLFNDFSVTKEIALGKNILKKQDYDNFKRTFENNDYDYINWLEKHNCKSGFISFSKPLFNERYDLAIFHIAKICGPLCGGSWITIYEFKNDEWIVKEILEATVQ